MSARFIDVHHHRQLPPVFPRTISNLFIGHFLFSFKSVASPGDES
jgi:hypothetical protein